MIPIFDTSAIVAIVKGEPGAEVALALLAGSIVSAVNFAEVVDVLARWDVDQSRATLTFDALALPIIAFDEGLARRTGELALQTRRWGLSLGDRACIALAERVGGVAVTADRQWKDAGFGVEIKLIR